MDVLCAVYYQPNKYLVVRPFLYLQTYENIKVLIQLRFGKIMKELSELSEEKSKIE